MPKIPKILHQCWLGGGIPSKIYDWMQTVWKVNKGFEYRLWTEDRLRDEGFDLQQFDKKWKHAAGTSGGFRLLILEKYGGIYLDCDVECIKPFDELLNYEAFAANQDWRLGNAVFGAIPYHAWIRWQIANIEGWPSDDAAWSTHLMNAAPREGLTILPNDTFYPWLWDVPLEQRRATDNTLAIHHWAGSWAKK